MLVNSISHRGTCGAIRRFVRSHTVLLFAMACSALLIIAQLRLYSFVDDNVSNDIVPQPFVHFKSQGSKSILLDIPLHSQLGLIPFYDEQVTNFLARLKARMFFSQLATTLDSVFVAVPAYRDEQCSITINQAFERALNPENVFIGLVDQYLPDEDTRCIDKIHTKWLSHVRCVEMDARDADGPNTARYIISKLWDGQKFYFSIDAHTRFMKHWDSTLINMMRPYPLNAIVTHYPVGKENEIGDNDGHIPWLCKGHLVDSDTTLLMQECGECHAPNRPGNISCVGPYIGAGFFFGRSTLITAAPPDRYLAHLFQGEELLLAARLWTAGFDIYSPTTNVISHFYGNRRHSVFAENSNTRDEITRTIARVEYILGATSKLPEKNDELSQLSMGNKRSIQQYMKFAGLDLRGRVMKSRCSGYFDWNADDWVTIDEE